MVLTAGIEALDGDSDATEGGNDFVGLCPVGPRFGEYVSEDFLAELLSSILIGPTLYDAIEGRVPALEDLVEGLVDPSCVRWRDVHDPLVLTAPAEHIRIQAARVSIRSLDHRLRHAT